MKYVLILFSLLTIAFSLNIRIQNDLISDINNPIYFFENGGIQVAPPAIPSMKIGVFKTLPYSTTTPLRGVITLPVDGYTAAFVSIAFQLNNNDPNSNRIGAYFGTLQASSNLLNSILSTAVLATSGWNYVDLGSSGMRLSYYMSSSLDNPTVSVVIQEGKELRDGIYYIKSAHPDFQEMYLKLAPNGYDVVIEWFERTERTKYQWQITYDNPSGHYKIKNVSNSLFLYGFYQWSHHLDVRNVADWPEPQFTANHWQWDIDPKNKEGEFSINNLYTSSDITLYRCRVDFALPPTLAPCKNRGTVMLYDSQTPEIQNYASWKISVQP